MTVARSKYPARSGYCPVVAKRGLLCLCGLMLATPSIATAEDSQTGTFREFGFEMSGGPRLASSAAFGLHWDLVLDARMFKITARRYRSYSFEAQYLWSDSTDLMNYLGRIEFGLGKVRFNRGRQAAFMATYLGVMAGFASGEVWDNRYSDLYQTYEDVEVGVTGVPLMAALGWRRIGGIGFHVEAVGGVTFILSQDDYGDGGESPSLIPSIGIRFGFGWDSFLYSRN